MNPQNLIRILTLTVCLMVLQTTHALSPVPDGGYPGGNTAEGTNALLSRTTGTYNTAIGLYSLLSLTDGKFCTGVGAGTLLVNTADKNTATGAGALLSNSTGIQNTANGTFALFSNTTGAGNTANGVNALFDNTDGNSNTANGDYALLSNTTGNHNMAIGEEALLNNTTGNENIALGVSAGGNVATADNVICIGALGANVSDSCFIGNIFGQTSPSGTAVLVNSNGRLGTTTSSRRFKEEIQPMERASEVLFALKPVSFRYKKEIDPACTLQFGLVAEHVEKVNPDLVVRDKEGKTYSVRYDQVNAMLLNEFLKEHKAFLEEQQKVKEQDRKMREQEATIAQLKKEMDAVVVHAKEQDAKIQKVSDQVQLSRPAPRLAGNAQR
jgi:hypothetical protein